MSSVVHITLVCLVVRRIVYWFGLSQYFCEKHRYNLHHFVSTSNNYYRKLVIMAPRKAVVVEKAIKNGVDNPEKPKATRKPGQKAVKVVEPEDMVTSTVEEVTKNTVEEETAVEVKKPGRKGKAVKATQEEIEEKPKKTGTTKKNTNEVKKEEKVERRMAPKRNAAKKDIKYDDKNEEEEEIVKKTVSKKKKPAAKTETKSKDKEKKSTTKSKKGQKEDKIQEENGAEVSEEPLEEKKSSRKRIAAPAVADPDSEDDEPESKKGKNAKAPLKNATATPWDDINFTTSQLNANSQPSNFHITSWNVDGIRAWLKKGGLEIITHDKPDILCLQETKCSDDKLPEEVKNVEGYKAYWCSSEKDGYAGVGILSKTMPIEVHYGIGVEDHDDEGRCIAAEYKLFYLVNVYVPNAGRKLVTLPKRLEWNKAFKDYIKQLNSKKPVIVCGDFNVAHTEIDLTNPKTNTKNAGFTPEEREGFTEFLADGYVDSYRKFYPDETGAYTFWTYMMNARSKNVGWRLDYFVVAESFVDRVCDSLIHPKVLGSDHCPLSLYLSI